MIAMKSRLLILYLILVAVVVVTACVSQIPPDSSVPTTPALTTVKVAYLPLISNGPLFIAKEEGYFAKQGINVEFEKFQSSALALPALANGDIAVYGGSVSPGFFNAIIKGSHVRIVADKGRIVPGSCNSTAFMVRRDLFEDGTIRNISDLKGRKIMAGSSEQYSTVHALAIGNLTMDEVTVVNMDYPSGVIALNNRAVDAGVLTEPYITQAMNSGSAVILLPAEKYIPDSPFPLYFGPTFLDKDPALAKRFTIAYLEGVKQYNAGKTERNLGILGNYTHLDHDLLVQSCWLPIAENGSLPHQPVMDYMDWLYANGTISQKLDADQVFDMSYVNYANGVLVNSTNIR
jgi:NitT/TauT family transport system substrate-binding protein